MNTNQNLMAVKIPSGFGMPVCGHAFVTTTAQGAFGIAVDPALAYATRKGTHAWSPPSS